MLCYLCGLPINGKPSRDHVPPQQLWSPEVRRTYNVNQLVTLDTHPACNDAYKRDEEYAVRVLGALAYDSPTGRSVVQHHFQKAKQGKGLGLHHGILKSFDPRPSGLYLPGDKMAMRVDGARLKRVIWKLVRGLWFIEYGKPLPEDTPYTIHIQEPENKGAHDFEEFWNMVRSQPSRGPYQAVFASKYLRYESEGEVLHGWAMLLWDRVICYCIHFDPDSPPDMSASGPRGRVQGSPAATEKPSE